MEGTAKRGRGRPKKIPDLQEQVVAATAVIVKEVSGGLSANPLEGYALYYALKQAGYPQGGLGTYVEDPYTLEQAYKPHPTEIYTQFFGDPALWEKMTDAICREWLKYRHGV